MKYLVVAGLTFLGIFGMALLGIRPRNIPPDQHFTDERGFDALHTETRGRLINGSSIRSSRHYLLSCRAISF